MPNIGQQLQRLRDKALGFFAHVHESYPQYEIDLWRSLNDEDRVRAEVLRQRLGRTVAVIADAFKRSNALGDDAIRTLHLPGRQMEAALRFKQWVGWGEKPDYFEDSPIGYTSAGGHENVVDAVAAKSIFQGGIDRINGLLEFTVNPVSDAMSDQKAS